MAALEVILEVKTDQIDAFIAACKDNAEHTWKEPGNLRFEMYQEIDKPERFLLIEEYDSENSQSAHMESDHFQRWYQATKSMVVSSDANNVRQVFSKPVK